MLTLYPTTSYVLARAADPSDEDTAPRRRRYSSCSHRCDRLDGKTSCLCDQTRFFTNSLQTTAVGKRLKRAQIYFHGDERLTLFRTTFLRLSLLRYISAVANLEGRGRVTERTRVCVCDWLGGSNDRNIQRHDWLYCRTSIRPLFYFSIAPHVCRSNYTDIELSSSL